MDFGLVGFDGMVGSESGFPSLVSDAETRQKGYGSGFLKQERSGPAEEDWRSLKMARNDDFSTSKTMLFPQRNPSSLRSNSLFSDGQPQQQMLSFSSPKSDPFLLNNDGGLMERSLQNSTLPYSYHTSSTTYPRNTGLGSGSLGSSMHGVLAGVRGPFTPSQWMELEHQALIYKYINANVPIPSNLLIPIRKALNPTGFSGFGGSLRPNTLGWGSFHLGFSSNTDPEPGRCRRTDGKKWRCSRDAVADQKYCERHMNRGRHRSRKPVEGQTGHAGSGPATAKVIPMASSSASVVASGGASNSLTIAQHQIRNLQQGAADPSVNTQINRNLLNKENMGSRIQESQGLSILSPNMNLRPKDTPFSIPKQHNPFEESSRTEFGLVPSDSLLNPSERSSYIDCRNFGSSSDLNDPEPQDQHPLRHFIDDWPKNRSDRSSITWPEIEEIQSDRTQLSISIPVASSDFSSASSSPTHDKLALSPLRLSREFDPIQMGLGVGSILNEPNHRQANWIPISWETSMGGPLGEVLNNTNNTTGDGKNSSALNLMTVGWDSSPRMGSSPTGVLQKTTFGSLSNSSTGSSPRAETNKTHDRVSLCDDLLGSTLVNSSSIPSI
ncbi:WRC [Macleaya cordata]|uniref:Growth-regulating factor n=1 Tax=Macleaya cordata TaxID=56857 RepID=A0A200PSK6_MACCD|nr:WRC [Macleaya cordata]